MAATRAEQRLIISHKKSQVWDNFGPFIESWTELPDYRFDQNSQRPPSSFRIEDIQQKLRATAQLVQSCSVNSYSLNVGSEEKTKITLFTEPHQGLGSFFGELVHAAWNNSFITLIYLLNKFCLQILAQKNGPQTHLQDMLQHVQGFLNSSLYEQVKQAHEVYCEVPFSLHQSDSPQTHCIAGTMILPLKIMGWSIVDFETDVVGNHLKACCSLQTSALEL